MGISKIKFDVNPETVVSFKNNSNRKINYENNINSIEILNLEKGPINTEEGYTFEIDITSKLGKIMSYNFDGTNRTSNINEIIYIISDIDNYNEFVNEVKNMEKTNEQRIELAKFSALLNYAENNSIFIPLTIKTRLTNLANMYQVYTNIDTSKKEYEEYYSQLDMLSKFFESRISELNPDVERLKNTYNIKMSALKMSYIDIERLAKEAGKIREELDPIEQELYMFDFLLKQINQEIKLKPYEMMRTTTSYQEFLNKYNNGEIKLKKIEDYVYMSKDQSLLYNYLLHYESGEIAEKYLSNIADSINKAKGAAEAAEFISKLNMNNEDELKTDLLNILGVSGQGFYDGLDNFLEGLYKSITNNNDLSVDDYKRIMILNYLKNNSSILDEYYELSYMMGNMSTSIAASIIVSYYFTPEAGSTAGLFLMGVSSYGNNKLQARAIGNNIITSSIYAIFTSMSEVTLEKYLGNIPWLNVTAAFNLRRLLLNGGEEVIELWVRKGCDAVILGENIDWSTIPKESAKSFMYGVLLSAFLNEGKTIIDITINNIKYKIDVNKTLKYLSENPDVNDIEAIAKINGLPEIVYNPNSESDVKPNLIDVQNFYNDLKSNDKIYNDLSYEQLSNFFKISDNPNNIIFLNKLLLEVQNIPEINRNMTFEELMIKEKIPINPKKYSLTCYQTRIWYLYNEQQNAIKNAEALKKLNPFAPNYLNDLETLAIKVFNERNNLRSISQELMIDKDMREFLQNNYGSGTTDATMSFETIVNSKLKKISTIEEAYKSIIKSSTKSNSTIDSILWLNREKN